MEVNITVPSSLSEIPLKHYQEFLKVRDGSTDDEFIAQKMVQIFCGISLSDVVKMKLTSLNELVVHFTNLFSEKPKFKTTFEVGGIEFGFIPDLEEISYGEYVDLESHLSTWENYNKAMAVMYRPIKERKGNKYNIKDYDPDKDMQELMKFAPLDVCISSSVFFWTLGSELLTATLNYLEREVKKNKKISATLAKEGNLPNNGDGIKAFMQSQREILQSLTRLPNIDLLNVSPISYSRSKKEKLNKENLTDK